MVSMSDDLKHVCSESNARPLSSDSMRSGRSCLWWRYGVRTNVSGLVKFLILIFIILGRNSHDHFQSAMALRTLPARNQMQFICENDAHSHITRFAIVSELQKTYNKTRVGWGPYEYTGQPCLHRCTPHRPVVPVSNETSSNNNARIFRVMFEVFTEIHKPAEIKIHGWGMVWGFLPGVQ
jgi:hypothetical protein